VAGLVLAGALVLMVEIQLARMGPRLGATGLDLDLDQGEQGLRMVWVGDSTASGVGASSAERALPRQVAAGLGRPASVSVLATSGATVADALGHQVPRVAARRPDIVLVSVGANDTTHLTARGEFRRRYEELVRKLSGLAATGTPPAADGVEVVLLGVPDMGAIPRLPQPLRAVTGWRGERLDAEIVAVAAAHHARYVDIAGSTGPAFRRDPDRYFAADRYHPSDAGYGLWARAVLATLRAGSLGISGDTPGPPGGHSP
jgi:acyl-CoA thioesterase-1